jgi:predicted dienelactone hydrolase
MRLLFKAALTLVIALAVVAYVLMHPPAARPDGALSQENYRRGSHKVSHQSITWVDTSRPTMANGNFKGSASREFKGRIWFPTDNHGGPYPLLIYCHGFMSRYEEGEYLLDFLASHGFVAVSVNFPLSNGAAPGGPIIADTVNQAHDVSFLIDQMLARSKQADNLLYGRVDPHRIAALGLSLGGLTTELAGFSPQLKDPRIRAAISMAGPSQFLTPDFFDGDSIPLMYIGGTADAIVPYRENALPIPKKYKNSVLVTLEAGTHIGFAGVATTLFRWFDNADQIGCMLVMRGLRKAQEAAATGKPMPGLGELIGGPGVDANASSVPCQNQTFPRAMRPARQHALVTLAVYSFLEEQFSSSEAVRLQMHDYLFKQLPTENRDVTVTPGD